MPLLRRTGPAQGSDLARKVAEGELIAQDPGDGGVDLREGHAVGGWAVGQAEAEQLVSAAADRAGLPEDGGAEPGVMLSDGIIFI